MNVKLRRLRALGLLGAVDALLHRLGLIRLGIGRRVCDAWEARVTS